MNSRGSAWIIILAFILLGIIVFAVLYRFSETTQTTPQQTNPYAKTYQEIHVESIQNDTFYMKLLAYMQQHPKTRLMLIVSYFKNATENKIIRQRYAELAKKNYTLGLHVHIAVDPEINSVPLEKQTELIRFGLSYLQSLNITGITHFAPGYWSWNMDTVKACHVNGIQYFHMWEPRAKKIDTTNWKTDLNMTLVSVKSYAHDNEL